MCVSSVCVLPTELVLGYAEVIIWAVLPALCMCVSVWCMVLEQPSVGRTSAADAGARQQLLRNPSTTDDRDTDIAQ